MLVLVLFSALGVTRQLIRGGKLFIFHVEKDHRALIISIEKKSLFTVGRERGGGGGINTLTESQNTEDFKG